MRLPEPTHRERIALFRLSVVGDLLATELSRGDLQTEFKRRARKRYSPPSVGRSRTYHWKTLQRWYYAAKADLSHGLLPKSRVQGFAQRLSAEQREFLVQMRREHQSASAELLLSEAVRHGVVGKDAVSLSTLRRLFDAAGLPRLSSRRALRPGKQRRRWRAAHPGDLWHGDVCHVVLAEGQQRSRRVLVHGFLDDASRYFVALSARTHERERDTLEVLCGALLRHPPPRVLYLDNGSCYRGEVLALVCKRLGIHLIHAKPYSPEARGKMERAWRTLRQRCTDHLRPAASLHRVDQALAAWLDADYHRRPHAGLMGDKPGRYYKHNQPGDRVPLTLAQLARALEVSVRRQVRKDATFDIDGTSYEVTGRHIAGKRVDVVLDGLTGQVLRVRHQKQPVRFGLCDARANRNRKRPATEPSEPTPESPFDPISALIAQAREVDDE